MKLKHIVLLIAGFILLPNTEAQIYISKNGHIWFYSYTPIEEIEAHNRQAVGIVDASTGEVQYSMLIKSFEFKKALMQEHFNENYMESTKIPKSSFKGKITNLKEINFNKDGTYPAEVSGDITVHGVTRPLTVKGTIIVKDGAVTTQAKFSLAPKDFNITIPAVVENNIAKSIDVNIDVTLTANQ